MRAQLILALDVDTPEQAAGLVQRLYPQVTMFKVGLQLFTAGGPQIIERIHAAGGEVFLDLKFHDIPHTVAQAVRQAARLKVAMTTVHIAGGRKMLEAAVEGAEQEADALGITRTKLIGVTVLTSQEAGVEEVLQRAQEGLHCGLDGVVCSVREAKSLRQNIKQSFIIVTPGIRAVNAPADDQKRTATVREAIAAGSDYLVVGRPILQAPDPVSAVKELLNV